MNKSYSPLAGILLMLGASISFAGMATAMKLVSRDIPVAEVVFIRSLIMSIAIVSLIVKNQIPWIGKEPKILIARGVVGFVAMMLYFWCLSKIDLGTAVMLNYTAPISAVLTAHLFFREKLTLTTKTAVLCSLLGVYLLSAPQLYAKPTPLLAGLLSGLLAGTVHVLIRYSHEEEEPLIIIFYFTVISTLGSVLFILKDGFVIPSAVDWVWLLVVIVTSLIGQLGLTYSLRTAPVSVVSPFGYITPVVGLFLGAWIWRESLTSMSLLGCVIIIVCGMVLYKYHSSV